LGDLAVVVMLLTNLIGCGEDLGEVVVLVAELPTELQVVVVAPPLLQLL